MNDLPKQSAAALKNSKAFQNLDNATQGEIVSILDSVTEQQQRSGTVTEVVPIKNDTTPATVISIGSGTSNYTTLTLNQSKQVSYQKKKTKMVTKEYQEKVSYQKSYYLLGRFSQKTFYDYRYGPTQTKQVWEKQKQRSGGTWEYWGLVDFPDAKNFVNGYGKASEDGYRQNYWWSRSGDCGWMCIPYTAKVKLEKQVTKVTERGYKWRKVTDYHRPAKYKHFDSDSEYANYEDNSYPRWAPECKWYHNNGYNLTQESRQRHKFVYKNGQRRQKDIEAPCKKTKTKYKWVTKTKNVTKTYFVEAKKTKSYDTTVTTSATKFPSGGSDDTFTLNEPGRATEFAFTVAPNSLPLKPKDHFRVIIDKQNGGSEWIEMYVDEQQDVIVIKDDEGNVVKKEKGTVLAFNYHDQTLNGIATDLDIGLPESGNYQVKLQHSEGVAGSLGLTMKGTDMETSTADAAANVHTTGGMAEARFRVTFQTSGSTYTKTFDANPSYAENIADIGVAAGGNVDPKAGATGPETVVLGDDGIETVGVFAAGSTDEDGTIESYEWTQLTGPSSGVIINNKNAKSASLTFDQTGTYTFQLKVTDNNGATDTKVVQIEVIAQQNEEPNVQIDGTTKTKKHQGSPITITLDGTATDPDGTITGYSWSLLSGDASAITILSRSSADTQVRFSSPGTYTFQLSATDDGTPQRSGEATITVKVPDSSGSVPDSGSSTSGSSSGSDGSDTIDTTGGKTPITTTGDTHTLTGKTKTYSIASGSPLASIDEVYSWKYRKGKSGNWYTAGISGTSGAFTFDKGAGTYQLLAVFRVSDGTQKEIITIKVKQAPSLSIGTDPGYSGDKVSSEIPITFEAETGGVKDYGSITWNGYGLSGSGTTTTVNNPSGGLFVSVLMTDVRGTGDTLGAHNTFAAVSRIDTDGDGLIDGKEADLETAIQQTDTDGDSLADKAEVNGITNPTSADSDLDVVNDAVDASPTTREDADSFEEPNGPISPDGGPESDFDGDSIQDHNDGCPTDPEDNDGYQEADGCAEPRSSSPGSTQSFSSTDGPTSSGSGGSSGTTDTGSLSGTTDMTDTTTSDGGASDTPATAGQNGALSESPGSATSPLSMSTTGTSFTNDSGSSSDSSSDSSGSSDTTLGGSTSWTVNPGSSSSTTIAF